MRKVREYTTSPPRRVLVMSFVVRSTEACLLAVPIDTPIRRAGSPVAHGEDSAHSAHRAMALQAGYYRDLDITPVNSVKLAK
ncbi:hypothetical protein [Streptomyces badius]|uniref:Uncharacterized protein n=1 Tax=Streptomyces badius TaxID=1941 RepID=A0ABQ2T2I5_STRBA|nr:hypothetical protein [Streptomyces badius]GGS49439.1 hypothetical protein GCM10010253_24700 [Streptomyces badius]